jgi:hypothetical protein
VGRALDQRGQVLAGEPADLDAKVLDLRVYLRPVGYASARRVKVLHQAAHHCGRLPQTRQPDGRPSFAGSDHSDIRMPLSIYTRPTDGTQDSATVALEVTFFDPAVDMSLTRDSVSTAGTLTFFPYLQDFLEWRDPDSNRGHHDFQSFAEALRYAENSHR